MKIITHDQIKSLNISPLSWFDWAAEVLRQKYSFTMPPKIAIHWADSYFNTMPSILASEGRMGVKVVDRFTNRNPSVLSKLLLYDSDAGEPLALMDATLITAMRTGAVTIHSMELLAKRDANVVGFMGFGNIGAACLDVLAERYREKPLTVKFLRHKDHFDMAQKRYANYPNFRLLLVESAEQVIRESDVVISAITFTDQILGRDDWFKAGCLVIPVHLRGFQNCDLFFDKVCGDDRGQVQGFKYFNRFKSFAETAEVVCGTKPGRESDDERIIVYNVGLSLHDVYAAAKIYELATARGFGIEVPPMSPSEKFWM